MATVLKTSPNAKTEGMVTPLRLNQSESLKKLSSLFFFKENVGRACEALALPQQTGKKEIGGRVQTHQTGLRQTHKNH